MRRAALVIALTLAAGCGGGGEDERPRVEEPPLPPRGGTFVLVGDSLARPLAPLLGEVLPGWDTSAHARDGRPLAEGMDVLDDVVPPPDPADGRIVLALSLFSNNRPGEVDALEAAVRRTVRLARERDGCAVWATIAHPPFDGVPYGPVNERLRALERELAPRLILVPWQRAVTERPALLKGDGVHATTEGYRVRAELYADAARTCD